jgi:hypothetical protein
MESLMIKRLWHISINVNGTGFQGIKKIAITTIQDDMYPNQNSNQVHHTGQVGLQVMPQVSIWEVFGSNLGQDKDY